VQVTPRALGGLGSDGTEVAAPGRACNLHPVRYTAQAGSEALAICGEMNSWQKRIDP
jgi:hypothetical protein